MRRKITLIVVDDVQAAIDNILAVLAPFVDLVIKKTFTDSLAALDYLRNHHVDFVLLDIDMPTLNGLDFALQMPKEIKVIFCTAHREYALESYEYEAVDYLLKPVRKERFSRALGRMKDALRIQGGQVDAIGNDYYYFMLKGGVKFFRTKVDFNELVFVEARDGRTYFYLIGDLVAEDRRIRAELEAKRRMAGEEPAEEERVAGRLGNKGIPCSMSLDQIAAIVKGTSMMRIHRGFILNTDFYRRYGGRIVDLKGLDEIKLPTGERAHHIEFFTWMEENNFPDNG